MTKFPCPDSDCALPIDVVVRSSDATSFGGHLKNIEMFSTGIPMVDSLSSGVQKMADISCNSYSTKLLLRFMHNKPQPDLSSIDWNEFLDLFKAIQKYQVYSAMAVCKFRMESFVEGHPFEVFHHASDAGYKDLSTKAINLCADTHPFECFIKASESRLASLQDRVAKKILLVPAKKMFNALEGIEDGLRTYSAWTLQREAFTTAYIEAVRNPPQGNLHKGGAERCSDWYQFYATVVSDILEPSIEGSDEAIDNYISILSDCKQCLVAAARWKTRLQVSVPPFSTFMGSVTD